MSRLHRATEELVSFLHKNEYRSNDHSLKNLPNRVNLREWNVEKTGLDYYNKGQLPYNLGDTLSRVVVEYMLSRKGLTLDTWVKKRRLLFAVGSGILHSYADAVIWGNGIERKISGILETLHRKPIRKLDIRAVRGPLTRKYLQQLGHKCPEVYGDPAILMPMIYRPKKSNDNGGGIIVIPQFVTESALRKQYPDEEFVSMNTKDYAVVIDKIYNSKKVVTSSLHGIILAETYGVPAVFFRGLHKSVDFKYLDWYKSTGRHDIKIAESIDEARGMDAPSLPDLGDMQLGLIDSFPYDLWK